MRTVRAGEPFEVRLTVNYAESGRSGRRQTTLDDFGSEVCGEPETARAPNPVETSAIVITRLMAARLELGAGGGEVDPRGAGEAGLQRRSSDGRTWWAQDMRDQGIGWAWTLTATEGDELSYNVDVAGWVGEGEGVPREDSGSTRFTCRVLVIGATAGDGLPWMLGWLLLGGGALMLVVGSTLILRSPMAAPLLAFVRRDPAANVFISYRRRDSAGWAGRLNERLSRRLGGGRVFMDVVDIEGGAEWEARLRDTVDASDVVVVLIGQRWAGPNEDGTRRIDNPKDWVRNEVADALRRPDKRVIPVLVDGMSMGELGNLPDDLASLTRRQARTIHPESFDDGMKKLLSDIRAAVKAQRRGAKAPPPA